MTLAELLKDSAYKLTQFSAKQIQELENKIIVKQIRDKATPYIICLVRGKEIKLTPEEIVRQLYIDTLHIHYGYSLDRIQCEYPVKTGSSSKRADIVVLDTNHCPYIIVELKQPNVKDGQEQLKSYCRFEGAPLGVWTNGADIEYFLKTENPKSKTVRLDSLSGLPNANQTLADYLHKPFTIKDLIVNDKLERRSLKEIITQFEDVVLANSGADSFEEIFKLIFTKLFDEFQSGSDKDEINILLKHGTPIEAINNKDFRPLQFRNTSIEEDPERREADIKKHLEKLFSDARKKWRGIFPADDSFKLTASHLCTCVSYLQDIKLFNSNLEVIDDAFEYLVNQESKGNKGQYFTPRYVIDMCVKMLNPQAHESMIDTASGSCGFPMHTIFHVWQTLAPENTNLFTSDKRTQAQIDYVQNKVFGIDFDPRSVRVGRALNLIAGDGQTNVLRLNTLDYKRWNETVKEQSWINVYNDGFVKLNELAKEEDNYKEFSFDILMANPPFAGDIKDELMIRSYELGKKQESAQVKKANKAGKLTGDKAWQEKVSRDVLFIERNLDFLKDGGRMAIVLPQGRFNNSSDKYLRDFIAERCRILAVVGLHGNTFKPHTGTKTSVLMVQKWHKTLCPKVDDYPIFFATMQKSGKDNSGEKIYIKDEDGNPIKDKHGHFVVDHDLFNPDGLTQDGIAEAFIEFAKKENLSFFDLDLSGFKNLKGLDAASLNKDLRGFKNLAGLYAEPFNEVKYRALLEKLEISEVRLSELERTLRIDAEFYSKENLLIESYIKKSKYSVLTDLVKVSDGNHMAISEKFITVGFPYYRGQDIHSFFIEGANPICIDTDTFNLPVMRRSHLKKGDVLLSIVGTIGKLGLVTTNNKATCSCKLAILRPSKIIAEFLSIFLSSKYGQNQIKKFTRGAVQMGLILEDFDQLLIPYFEDNFQIKIEVLVNNAYSKLEQSKSAYNQAENLLLNALGMVDFSPSTEKVNIKSFKDSFLATGRLDAEYYQPKYEEMMAHITAQAHNKLSELVIIQKSVETGSEAYTEDEDGLPYLRVADYNKFGITEPQKRLSTVFITENHKKLKDLKPKAGTILFSKDGSVGEAYCLREDANFITSGAVLHLTIRNKKTVLPEYLTLALNSTLIKMQSERDAGGSIILHWRISEIENVIVPIVDIAIQTKIAELIQQSFTLKSQSEALLTTAKRAVELAIETNEQTALDFIAKAV